MLTTVKITKVKIGQLAKEYCNRELPLQVMKTNAGYYIGTCSDEGPCSRESAEYWRHHSDAQEALDNGTFTQRDEP